MITVFRMFIVSLVLIVSTNEVNANQWSFFGNSEFSNDGFKINKRHFEQSQVRLVRVTSDVMSGFSDINLLVDQQFDIVALLQVDEKGTVIQYSPHQVTQGAVLLRKDGRDVVKLTSRDFSTHTGGGIDLTYLSNGIVGSHETFKMDLIRTGSNWNLYVNGQGGRVSISQMFFKGRTLFGKVIGIEKVIVK